MKIASDAQLRNAANVIQIGNNPAEGIIAQGAVAAYRIKLEENSPIRLSFPATGDQGQYSVEIFDSTGKAVYRDQNKRYSETETANIPFTPPKSDTYVLHIKGADGEGRYAVKMFSIALDAQLRATTNTIQVGGNSVEGVVAAGAVAEYRIELEALNPIRLNLAASGDQGKYNVEILDSTGKAVYRDPYKQYSGTETASIPFTASKSDTYLVHVTGTEGECKYSLNIKRLAGK